ncbi:MAG: hypothetical protein ACYDGW_07820 [Vulcanimicrobiaceae bacterium]
MTNRPLLIILALVLFGASPGVEQVPANTPAVLTLECSTTYGCEIDTPPNETLEAVSVTDQRFQTTVLAKGGATGARVKLLPSVATIPEHGHLATLRAEVDILTTRKEYRVIVSATRDLSPHILAFVQAQPAVIYTAPVHSAHKTTGGQGNGDLHSTALNLSILDFDWRSQGDNACTATFSIDKYEQLWCKLPASALAAPSAYRVQGRAYIPVNSTILRSGYVVIDGLYSPIQLDWPNGQHAEIIRT